MGSVLKKLLLSALFSGAVAVMVFVAAPASAAELVSNGGFEHPTGLNAGWNHSVSSTLFVQSGGAAHSGDYGLQFADNGTYLSDYVAQSLDTVVGETYHYSYWFGAAGEDGEPSNFFATLGTEIIGNFGYGGSYDYQHVFGDFVATSDQTTIMFTAYNTWGLFVLDDVSVTGPLAGEIDLPGGGSTHPIGGNGVPEPQTWALMLLGFGGIGMALRRRNAGALAVAA